MWRSTHVPLQPTLTQPPSLVPAALRPVSTAPTLLFASTATPTPTSTQACVLPHVLTRPLPSMPPSAVMHVSHPASTATALHRLAHPARVGTISTKPTVVVSRAVHLTPLSTLAPVFVTPALHPVPVAAIQLPRALLARVTTPTWQPKTLATRPVPMDTTRTQLTVWAALTTAQHARMTLPATAAPLRLSSARPSASPTVPMLLPMSPTTPALSVLTSSVTVWTVEQVPLPYALPVRPQVSYTRGRVCRPVQTAPPTTPIPTSAVQTQSMRN